jgi:hypothetical protein
MSTVLNEVLSANQQYSAAAEDCYAPRTQVGECKQLTRH